jgi:hypothetical protein
MDAAFLASMSLYSRALVDNAEFILVCRDFHFVGWDDTQD